MSAEALTPIRRALISVSDKRGLAELGAALAARGVEILSTGGSARALADAGIAVTEVSAHTGFPEIMDGRVKTLHPKIHGGILARRNLDADRKAMEDNGIAAIDLVVGSLYPFEATLAAGADPATCIENIDIGGPAMIRAAAKNHTFVTVVTDPDDYPALIAELEAQDGAAAILRLPKGGGWCLRAGGAVLGLEPSIYLGRGGEIRRGQQVVLTGHCARQGVKVKWAIKRIDRKRG